MGWNLNDYEDVASLNRWFQDNFPNGRIHVIEEYFNPQDQEVVFSCGLYRDANDLHPAVVNYARGKASDYPKNMARWYIEDTATSVIGRSILLIKGAEKTATKDSMRQVAADPGHKVEHPNKPPVTWEPEAVKEVPNEPQTVVWDEVETKAFQDTSDIVKALGAEIVGFKCKHGDMFLKEGTSKAGKPYHGYVCGAKSKNDQCEAKWAKQGNNGQWVFEDRAAW